MRCEEVITLIWGRCIRGCYGEKLAADRNRRVFGMRCEAVIALIWGRCLRWCSGLKFAACNKGCYFWTLLDIPMSPCCRQLLLTVSHQGTLFPKHHAAVFLRYVAPPEISSWVDNAFLCLVRKGGALTHRYLQTLRSTVALRVYIRDWFPASC
jgi:hypothetical protein